MVFFMPYTCFSATPVTENMDFFYLFLGYLSWISFYWKFNAEKLFDHQTTSKPVETGFLPKLNLKGREDVKKNIQWYHTRHSVVLYS